MGRYGAALYEPAVMAHSQLIHEEIDTHRVEYIRNLIFNDSEDQWEPQGGSPWQEWYRAISSDDSQQKSDGRRLIAWKKGKPFQPKNLFFRSLDTGRFLPMHLAGFNVQVYADTPWMEYIDKHEHGRQGWTDSILLVMVSRPCASETRTGVLTYAFCALILSDARAPGPS